MTMGIKTGDATHSHIHAHRQTGTDKRHALLCFFLLLIIIIIILSKQGSQ
ncbi:hypothetical protein DAPPUDRAFT_299843 [Daphnia pulex]|uniref:Uncharacterized protein n=1 Tax=Daphnia pulex TaxID=6669 RepID=E9FS55_DAPPU|nr:hypothetical protein DAPPUDRAFT_299843 [Daphnia pulex]|eukprot:EFX89973.1 hypothetical protein DAPPUDRAFT_299843 [Daphnia pulex]